VTFNEKRRKISDLFFHRMIGPLASGETPNFWYHLEGNFMNCSDIKSEFYLVVWGESYFIFSSGGNEFGVVRN
jgi:hypothetical protein